MNAPASAAPLQLGFLAVRHDGGGYIGGYLVTNAWGRPLEFRMSTSVQPNRVQQILYADTLSEYLSGEVIGKTLVEKTAAPVQIVLTDSRYALSVRRSLVIPAAWVAPSTEEALDDDTIVRPAERNRGPLVAHPEFADDAPNLRELFDRLGGLDLLEPFARIRDAISEARKLGVMQRAG